jgi:hypothetical protein
MNKDIRVDLGFFDHRKTRKLIARFGLGAAWGLLRLWAFAARSRPSGLLSGMSSLDIAMEMHIELNPEVVNWTPDDLVAYMKSDDCRWIDDTPNGSYLHDWHDHNPWAAKADDRSDKSRFLRMAHTHPSIYNELKEKGVNAVSRKAYDTLTACQRAVEPALSPAPVPVPAPIPVPVPIPKALRKPNSKPAPNPEIRVVVDYFYEQYKAKFGSPPLIDKKDAALVSSRLKNFTAEGLKDAIDFFLSGPKVRDHPTLAVAMSTHSLNSFEQKNPENTCT